MRKRTWANNKIGGTPLEQGPLNDLENDLGSALLQLARDPSALFTGTITRDSGGAPISAAISWPDGTPGVYAGTPSTTFAGAVDAYYVTYAATPLLTITQPAVTRDGGGNLTNRPAMTIT